MNSLFFLLALIGIASGQFSINLVNNVNGQGMARAQCPKPEPVEPACAPVEGNWDYHDHGHDWPTMVNVRCGGSSQSPIDLPSAVNRNANPHVLGDAKLKVNPGDAHFDLTFTNNGHALVAGGFLNSENPPWIEIDGCKRVLAQFHLHAGSEHTVSGHQPAMELHLVFATRSAPSTLFGHHDDLVVIGIMFDPNDAADFSFLAEPLRRILAQRLAAQESFALDDFDFTAIYRLIRAASNANGFYRYQGSLTTPPCSEIVTWIVATEIQGVPSNLLAAAEAHLHGNYRAVQDRRGRGVYTMTHQ